MLPPAQHISKLIVKHSKFKYKSKSKDWNIEAEAHITKGKNTDNIWILK